MSTTVALRADACPRAPRASTPLPDYALNELRRRLANNTADRIAATLDVVPQTVRAAARGDALTRSMAGWLVVSLGFPRPVL